MKAESILNDMGVAITVQDGKIRLCGLDRLSPEERERTVIFARDHHEELEAVFLPPQPENSIDPRLERLAAEDTNISALLSWKITPRIVHGELILDGVERWTRDPVATSNIGLWLNHLNETGEPRRERVKRALRTGRSQTLCKF